MRLGGKAQHMCDVTTKHELEEAIKWAESQQLPVIVIGEGSNIVWSDNGFVGLVIVNKIMGITCVSESKGYAEYQIGAGEDWDAVVAKTTELGLSGIECLSLIPGKSGATPVQNVGAYGQEIAQTLISLEAYDKETSTFVTLKNDECDFGYRTSRFKTSNKGRFFILSIQLRLSTAELKPPFYASLQHYLDLHKITDYSPASLRRAVIAIRSDKMPDWRKIANNGSFFANPIVSKEKYNELQSLYPEIVGWPRDEGYKLSAGWLLEKAGLKGFHDKETGMATSDKTALVMINEHASSTADLITFKKKITDSIKEKFNIELEQEPELMP